MKRAEGLLPCTQDLQAVALMLHRIHHSAWGAESPELGPAHIRTANVRNGT